MKMTSLSDEEFTAQRDRLEKLAEWWQPRLALDNWRIEHFFHPSSRDMPDSLADAPIALCNARWEYLLARLDWDFSATAALDDETLEEVFVHELMHIHLSETRVTKDARSHQERVATELARSFLALKHCFLPPHDSDSDSDSSQ